MTTDNRVLDVQVQRQNAAKAIFFVLFDYFDEFLLKKINYMI